MNAERVRLTILIVPKDGWKHGGGGHNNWAEWDADTNTISLREERIGINRLADFLHEMKHVWVDRIDNDR